MEKGKDRGHVASGVHVPLLSSEAPTGEGGAPINKAGSEEGPAAVPLDISEKDPGALEQQMEGAFGGWWDLHGSPQGPQPTVLAAWALGAGE